MDLEMFFWGGWFDGYLILFLFRFVYVVYYNVL